MTHKITFSVLERAIGRIDQCLVRNFPQYSRTQLQAMIKNKQVTVNGETVTKSYPLEEKDRVSLHAECRKAPLLYPDPTPLEVIYEDDHILCINKETGIAVHPSPTSRSSTIVHRALAHTGSLPENAANGPLRPGIVHRLDKGTTGIMVIAKTPDALKALVQMFKERQVKKTYIALCYNTPNDRRCDLAIERCKKHREKRVVTLTGGKEAHTTFSILAHTERYSLVQATPTTGRTHQIRVHLAHLKAPILGDSLYGNTPKNSSTPLYLHAQSLQFTHPITNEPLSLTAPLPEHFQQQLTSFPP